ncbi:acyl-[acyl-carrier-protein] thioesterase [Rubrivirga sp. IMCC43871]|uniref:acyl-[acyl-carrier-protein] thioesterase n=1 Tax=Rubrivirga sp. IMCC43871 TaxID=3391575 RepID=UPI0039902CCE
MSEPPLVWTEPFRIRAVEAGPDGAASVLTVCDLFQEAAGEHALAADREGFPLPDGGWSTWVLSQLSVRLHRRPSMREHVAVETWPASLDGLRATRDFRLTDAEGGVLAVATSRWFLIDVERRRPVRLPAAMDGFEATEKPRAHEMPDAPAAPESVEHGAEFAVRRSDLDRVGHANNVRFIEWALEALPDDAGLGGVDVAYKAEANAGDVVLSEAGPLVGNVRRHRLAAPNGRTFALARTHWSR